MTRQVQFCWNWHNLPRVWMEIVFQNIKFFATIFFEIIKITKRTVNLGALIFFFCEK